MVYLFSFLTFISILGGGYIGLKFKDKLHLILGFTAGVLLSVVAFDLLPEIFNLVNITGINPVYPMIALVSGFLIFHIFEKMLLIHHAHEEVYGKHKHPHVGIASALALIGHSFMDGVAIGFGGGIVAVAVISHAFSDGLNNVSLTLVHKNTPLQARILILIHAIAPILGTLVTRLFVIPDYFVVLYLGFFAGFLLYIGASEILPEAHSEHSSWKTIAMTLVGVIFIFLVSRLA